MRPRRLLPLLPFCLPLALLLAPSSAWQKRIDAHGKTIIAYYASWQWYDRSGLAKPSNLDHSKVTRYNFAFFQINSAGEIWGTDEWADPIVLHGEFDWMGNGAERCSWDHPVEDPKCAAHFVEGGLIHQAHAAGVEVYPSIGGWTLSDPFPALAANPAARQKFADNCVRLIEDYDFDGIDIDWEYPGYAAHSGTPADTVNYSLFLREIRDALDGLEARTGRSYGLTAALPCGPDLIDNIQIEVVSGILTELNLMTYDFHGSWNEVTGVNAPLYDMEGSPQFSVHGCVRNWMAGGGDPDQINIGLPFYGRSFGGGGLTGMGQSFSGTGDMVAWSEDEGSPQYFNIAKKLSQFTTVRDPVTKTQYAYNSGGLVSYDDERAICDKTEYAMDNDLNGYIIWEISGDLMPDLSTPLLDATNNRLNNPDTRCEPDAPPATLGGDGLSDEASSDASPRWYPHQALGFCVNDGKLVENFVTSDRIFHSAKSCCEAVYNFNPDCLASSLDPSSSGKWINDVVQGDPWYPNQAAGRCVKDGKHEIYVQAAQMYSTADACCDSHFSFDGNCASESMNPPNEDKWYNSHGGCTMISPIPSWVTTFYDSKARCCKKEFNKNKYDSCLTAAEPVGTPQNNIAETPTLNEDNEEDVAAQLNQHSILLGDGGGSYVSEYELAWDLFYPHYNEDGTSVECRNDGEAPPWISTTMMKATEYECCDSFFFPSWSDQCISDHPFYPNFVDKSCVNDGKNPGYMAGDWLSDEMWKCCQNFYKNDEELLAQCTNIPTLGCDDCTLSDYLADFYSDGSSATAATVAAASQTIPTPPTPPLPPPTPPTPTYGGGGISTSNYCGIDWGDANSKCATPCPEGSDGECPTGERCYADCTGCGGGGSGGSGPCGWGNIGNGVCENTSLCCSQYGWCGSGSNYCSNGAGTTAGAVGTGSCGGGNVGNGICEDAGHCCSQYGWCGTEPEYCSEAAATEMEPVTAAAPLETVPATANSATAGTRDEEWLDSHNRRRRKWHEDNGKGYVPLQWSSALKADAFAWAQYLVDTNQFKHDKGPFGENIAMNSGSVKQRTTEDILSRWVEDEANVDYPDNGHLTQVLWRATKWVGCADARSGDYHVQVCRYTRPGNCNMADYNTWLEPMLADWSPC